MLRLAMTPPTTEDAEDNATGANLAVDGEIPLVGLGING